MTPLKEWLDVRGYSPRTLQKYLIFSRIFPEAHTQETINNWLLKHPQPLARAFARLYLHEYLGKKQIEIPPLKGRQKKRLPVWVSIDEFKQLQADETIPEDLRLMMALAYIAALRSMEIVSLRSTDIDHERLLVRGLGKGNKQFQQRINVNLAKRLWEYVRRKGAGLLFDYESDYASKLVKQACLFAIGKPYTLHKFRHGHCTYLRSLGWDLKEIQRSARHADPSTTMIYLHLNEADYEQKQKNALEGL